MTSVENIQDACLHQNINEDGICLGCGTEMNSLSNGSFFETSFESNHHSYRNTKVYTFETDLEKLDLPDVIKSEIISLCGITENITRQAPRLRSLFAFAYIAYIKLQIPFNPHTLAVKIGISHNDYNESLKLVSGLTSTPLSENNNIIVPVVVLSPCNYLKDIINALNTTYNLNLDYNEHDALLTLALQKDKLLYESKPYNVAVGSVKYLLDKKNVKINKFHACVGLSSSVIKNMTIDISRALNK